MGTNTVAAPSVMFDTSGPFTITGGVDAALFDIVGGNLVFKAAKDYEAHAHSYVVQVTAFDGANNTAKTITVLVCGASLTDTTSAPAAMCVLVSRKPLCGTTTIVVGADAAGALTCACAGVAVVLLNHSGVLKTPPGDVSPYAHPPRAGCRRAQRGCGG